MKKSVILCIDDEKIVLTSLKAQLKINFGREYNIETVENGIEALIIVNKLIRDGISLPVVIVDQIMPNMKGDEVLSKIHKISPYTNKIMLTGQADTEEIGHAVNNAHLYRYISKPWDFTDLNLTIAEAIRSYFQNKTIRAQTIKMKKLIVELSKYNKRLEKAVTQRTKVISKQKEELKKSLEEKVDINKYLKTTNKKLIESELKLKRLNATKDKFFSIISHDLKNPFASLLSISEFIVKNYKNTNEEDRIEILQKINMSANQIYSLLDNLLTWSSLQKGHIKINRIQFDISKVIKESINLYQVAAEKKGINIIVNIHNNMSVYADREMLSAIIRNFINNAIKFSNSDDVIEIKTKKINSYIEIIVSDSGIGIPEEDLKKLFRTDARLKTKGTSGEKGTGLGLILCKEFIEKNGGSIKVESKINTGSNFIICIPVNK